MQHGTGFWPAWETASELIPKTRAGPQPTVLRELRKLRRDLAFSVDNSLDYSKRLPDHLPQNEKRKLRLASKTSIVVFAVRLSASLPSLTMAVSSALPANAPFSS
jgi:hypothetical protein